MAVRPGGLQAWVNSLVQPCSQGQFSGWCRVVRRAEVEILVATLMSLRRTVAVTALPRALLARVPAARVRLKAMQASTSQAALAVNTLEGKCASADAFRSEFTCSILCRRLHNIDLVRGRLAQVASLSGQAGVPADDSGVPGEVW